MTYQLTTGSQNQHYICASHSDAHLVLGRRQAGKLPQILGGSRTSDSVLNQWIEHFLLVYVVHRIRGVERPAWAFGHFLYNLHVNVRCQVNILLIY